MAYLRFVNLQQSEKEKLLTMIRSSKIEYRYRLRAQIILLWAEGKTYEETQQQLSVSSRVVSKWRKRFQEKRLAGIKDQPRSGKPALYTEADKARVINKACSKPEGGYTIWSQRRIAEQVGMSQSKVQQILKEDKLKPHKVDYWCGKSPDPEFEQKMLEVIGLYLNPPENALVLSVDEKTQMQALDRTQPELPLRSGNAKRHTATYKRNGTVSLIAALAVHSGEITANPIKRNNAENFLKFLKKLDRKYRNKKLHIILDNLSIHKNKEVKQWLQGKRKIQLHFTPTYSSWLNQIEIWFNILSKDVLKGGIWHSNKQLVDQLIEYIDTYNKTRAKPFQWTYAGKKEAV